MEQEEGGGEDGTRRVHVGRRIQRGGQGHDVSAAKSRPSILNVVFFFIISPCNNFKHLCAHVRACVPRQEAVSSEARSALRRVHPALPAVPDLRVHGERLPVRVPASPEGQFVAGHHADDVPGRQRGHELPRELQLPAPRPGTEPATRRVTPSVT